MLSTRTTGRTHSRACLLCCMLRNLLECSEAIEYANDRLHAEPERVLHRSAL
jgi:hypothetical protein